MKMKTTFFGQKQWMSACWGDDEVQELTLYAPGRGQNQQEQGL